MTATTRFCVVGQISCVVTIVFTAVFPAVLGSIFKSFTHSAPYRKSNQPSLHLETLILIVLNSIVHMVSISLFAMGYFFLTTCQCQIGISEEQRLPNPSCFLFHVTMSANSHWTTLEGENLFFFKLESSRFNNCWVVKSRTNLNAAPHHSSFLVGTCDR